MIKLQKIVMLLLCSVQAVSASSSIVQTLQSQKVATVYCIAFQKIAPTRLIINANAVATLNGAVDGDTVSLPSSIPLKNIDWSVNNTLVSSGAFVSIENFSLSKIHLTLDLLAPAMQYAYTVNDLFGNQLATANVKSVAGNGPFGPNSSFCDEAGNLNNNIVSVGLDKGLTFISSKDVNAYYKRAGTPSFLTWTTTNMSPVDTSAWSVPVTFFIVQPVWQTYDVLQSPTLGATTPLISAAGAIGSVGLPLMKTQMDHDMEILLITSVPFSLKNGVQVAESSICLLSGSAAFLNNATDLAAGVYVYLSQPVDSLASGDTYAIFDNNGNQLGTGNIEIVGTVNGSIDGAIITGSGFENGCFAMQAPTNGVWPSMFVLQYVASGGSVTLPVPGSAAPVTGKHGKHGKHGKKRSVKKGLHHEWKKYEEALNITSTGILPADSEQVLKVKKAEKHVLKALKKASLPHKKFKKKLDNLWDNYTTAATSGNSASVATVVASIKKEEGKMLKALAAASA